MNRDVLLRRLDTARTLTLKALEGLTETQWTEIPEGFTNNILWNAGHLATVQGRLLYTLSGLPTPVPDSLSTVTGRGSSPKDWAVGPDPGQVLRCLQELVPRTVADDAAGNFVDFKPTELRPGLVLDSFEDALVFGILHEGIHIGMIMQLRKLVR